jgi:hypothetical protein
MFIRPQKNKINIISKYQKSLLVIKRNKTGKMKKEKKNKN